MLLDGKSVIITGAGSGVGRASALLFAHEGAKVVCAELNDDWVKETVRLVEEQGGTAVAQVCDVTKEAEVVAAVEAAVSSFGRLDVMFNNAGAGTPGAQRKFEEYDDAEWDRLMNLNLRGVFYGMKHAVRQFKAQGDGGVIVNTGSAAGIVGWGGTIYGTTKGGVHQLTKAVAIEMAPFDIRVNAVCPGAMPGTNYSVADKSLAFQPKPEEMMAATGALHPLGRPITAEDVAAAALYLASDAAHNVTGVLLPVDGGYVARADVGTTEVGWGALASATTT